MQDSPNRNATAGEIAMIVRRLPKYAKLTWLIIKDPALPPRERAALTAAVGYSVSPVDAIPGIIPVVGQMDDLAVLLYTIRWVLRSVPSDRADAYFAEAGLTQAVLEQDLDMVRESGIKVLKKTAAALGIAALWAVAIGKLVGREVKKGIENRQRKNASS